MPKIHPGNLTEFRLACNSAVQKRLEIHAAAAQLDAAARVVELADTPDLGSGSARIGGSSPLARTTFPYNVSATFLHGLDVKEKSNAVGNCPG
jgi:hypothetical protein